MQKFPAIDTVNPLSREQSIAVPTTGYEDVRAVALARLVLPSVKTIQVDWAQYGPKLAQVALTFGANDLDRVSTIDDESLGRRRTSVEDVKRNIAAAGFTPGRADDGLDAARTPLPFGSARSRISIRSRSSTGSMPIPISSTSASTCRRSARSCCTRAASTSGLIPAIEYLRGDYAIVPGRRDRLGRRVAIGGGVHAQADRRRCRRWRSTSARARRWR